MSVIAALSSLRDLTSQDPSPTMVPLLTRVLIVPLMIIARQIGSILALSGAGGFLLVSLLLSLLTGQPVLRSLGINTKGPVPLARDFDYYEKDSDYT